MIEHQILSQMGTNYEFTAIRIIQSLGESSGSPGTVLATRLKALGGVTGKFPVTVVEPFDRQDFFGELERLLREIGQTGEVPLLHFEAHGCESGLQLRDKTIVAWDDFYPLLARFNLATKFNLLVSHACCDGIHQIKIVSAFKTCPFTACLACQGEISTIELLDGFTRFYDVLIREGKAIKALATLQAEVREGSDTRFSLLTCERVFESVYAQTHAARSDPAHQADRVAHYRGVLEKELALQGVLARQDPAVIQKILEKADEDFMRRFYMDFFAVAQIPENAQRFDYQRMKSRAIEAAKTMVAAHASARA